MSTRRARIKAVTSLPPRRKNAETNENKSKNINTLSTTCTSDSNITPSIESKTQAPEQNFGHAAPNDLNRIESSVVESPKVPKTNISDCQSTSRSTVIASTSSFIKNTTPNTFLSPQRRDSPKKTFVSPVVRSPKPRESQKATPIVQQINDNVELYIKNAVVDKINHNCESQKKNDNANDETVFDGIVPLQPEGTTHKPIDLLKSEIISENAEVLFDPIVPLPSPSKVRPKLKPVPRLGPHRRNSVQGSASESEDESRRSLLTGGPATPAPARQRYDSHTSHSTMISLPNRDVSRVRNDSICSNISQSTVQPNIASPIKEKQVTKVRRPEVNRRTHASKRRRDFANRESLTMYDLIFYNPTSNPIIPDQDELKAKAENEKDIAAQTKKEEIEKGDPDEAPEEDVAPVPQIKLGPNGEIILDEKSLVIKPTESGAVSGTVREGAWSGGGGRYKRAPRSADWAAAETVRFYRALAALGTDFTLMAPLFPSRTRNELKLKFKKEEKLNGAQVDKALRSATGWDMIGLREEFEEERQKAAQKEIKEREQFLEQQRAERARKMALRRQHVRRSKGSNAVETTAVEGVTKSQECATADDLIERAQTEAHKHALKEKAKPVGRKRKLIYKTPDTLPKTPNIPKTPSIPKTPITPNTENDYATLTVINNKPRKISPNCEIVPNIANISTPQAPQTIPQVPSNIETGSLVVLTVNDPNNPGKKMLQTYIAHGPDKLTPVALPASFLNSVVGYMNKNSVRGSNGSSPVLSPSSIASHESRSSTLSNTTRRQRNSSFTITQL